MAETSEVAKITPALLGKPSRAKADGKEVALAIVFGNATGVKMVKSPNGDMFEALRGDFEATSLETGEILKSGILYLPTGIHDRILEKIKADPDTVVQFAIQLSAIPASNPQGYTWKATNRAKIEQADPLAKLREEAMAGVKVAPVAEPKAKKKK